MEQSFDIFPFFNAPACHSEYRVRVRVFHFYTFFEFLVAIFYFMQKCYKNVGEKI